MKIQLGGNCHCSLILHLSVPTFRSSWALFCGSSCWPSSTLRLKLCSIWSSSASLSFSLLLLWRSICQKVKDKLWTSQQSSTQKCSHLPFLYFIVNSEQAIKSRLAVRFWNFNWYQPTSENYPKPLLDFLPSTVNLFQNYFNNLSRFMAHRKVRFTSRSWNLCFNLKSSSPSSLSLDFSLKSIPKQLSEFCKCSSRRVQWL